MEPSNHMIQHLLTQYRLPTREHVLPPLTFCLNETNYVIYIYQEDHSTKIAVAALGQKIALRQQTCEEFSQAFFLTPESLVCNTRFGNQIYFYDTLTLACKRRITLSQPPKKRISLTELQAQPVINETKLLCFKDTGTLAVFQIMNNYSTFKVTYYNSKLQEVYSETKENKGYLRYRNAEKMDDSGKIWVQVTSERGNDKPRIMVVCGTKKIITTYRVYHDLDMLWEYSKDQFVVNEKKSNEYRTAKKSAIMYNQEGNVKTFNSQEKFSSIEELRPIENNKWAVIPTSHFLMTYRQIGELNYTTRVIHLLCPAGKRILGEDSKIWFPSAELKGEDVNILTVPSKEIEEVFPEKPEVRWATSVRKGGIFHVEACQVFQIKLGYIVKEVKKILHIPRPTGVLKIMQLGYPRTARFIHLLKYMGLGSVEISHILQEINHDQ